MYLSCDVSSSKYNIFRSRSRVEVDSPFFFFPSSLLGSTFDFLFWPLEVVGVDTINANDCFFDFEDFRAIEELERVMRCNWRLICACESSGSANRDLIVWGIGT